MTREPTVAVGRIVRPHGVRGELGLGGLLAQEVYGAPSSRSAQSARYLDRERDCLLHLVEVCGGLMGGDGPDPGRARFEIGRAHV